MFLQLKLLSIVVWGQIALFSSLDAAFIWFIQYSHRLNIKIPELPNEIAKCEFEAPVQSFGFHTFPRGQVCMVSFLSNHIFVEKQTSSVVNTTTATTKKGIIHAFQVLNQASHSIHPMANGSSNGDFFTHKGVTGNLYPQNSQLSLFVAFG